MKYKGIIKNETTPKTATNEICFTLTGSDSHRGGSMAMILKYNGSYRDSGGGIAYTMLTDHENRPTDQTNYQVIEENDMDIVRRLTPLECERLQGFPDGWTDLGEWTDTKGKVHKEADSPRYKALGNSIALPQWWVLVNNMKPYLGEGATLGSLFDGIGGFPLVWEKTYGWHTAKWASEIEEFPIAVTKKHFDDENGDLYELVQ